MAQKQFSLTTSERIAVKDLVAKEKEYVEQRNGITTDILTRLGLDKDVKLDIVDLERGIVVATIPDKKEKSSPKLVEEEDYPDNTEDSAPAQPE